MILFNFDVLARPSTELGQRQPDPQGRFIWSMLHEKEMGRICLVVNQEYDREMLETWLKRELFKPAVYEFVTFDDPVLEAERIHTLAAIWGKAKWYVDNDPRVCARTLQLGIPTLLVAAPYIIRPEWNGEKTIKAWDNIVEEMDTQAIKEASRTWGDL